MTNDFITLKNNKNFLLFSIDTRAYSLEAIKKTCFVFSDNLFFFIKKQNKNNVLIQVESKGKEFNKEIIGDFYNELLNNDLREDVVKNNKKIKEIIISRALYSAIDNKNTDKKPKKKKTEDPLGIMQPWEEKYEKK